MKHRLGPPLAGIAATLVLLSVMAGGETGAFGGLLVLLVVMGLSWAAWGWFERRRPATPSGWAQAAAISFRPAAVHAAASPGGVAMALSRVEARELASSASVGVGVGFCGLVVYMFGYEWAADYSGGLIGSFELYPIYVHPLAGLLVLAAHRARTRSRRDGAQELFDTCPTNQTTRTVGHLLTAWMPALLAVVFLVAETMAFRQAVTVVHGQVGARQVAAVLGAAALCIGATCLGVALARWAPWTLVPVAAVIAIGFATTALATAGDRLTEPLRQLSTWLNDPDETGLFTAPHWLAHHLWILALVGLVAVLALLRDLPRPGVFAAGAVLVVGACGSAVAATRPIDASDAQRIAALINEPEAHQRCVDRSGLPVCTYPTDTALAEHFAGVIAPVVAAAPLGTLDGWAVRHRWDVALDDLDPEVRRLVAGESNDRQLIPIELIGHHLAEESARFWVALTAVGITADALEGGKLVVAGQARGVVAFWLATRGADADMAADMTSFNADAQESTAPYDRPWPDSCFAGPAPVVWKVADVDAGRLLVEAPETEVAQVLYAQWDHFMDPDTSTEELLAAVGLTQGSPRDGVTRRARASADLMQRIKPFLLGMGGILIFLGVAGVGGVDEDRNGPPIAGLMVVVGLVAWMTWGWMQRRRPTAVDGWAPSAAVAYRPSAARPSGPTIAVPMALSRVEVRQLSGSVAMGAGIGFCGLALWLFGSTWGGDYGGEITGAYESAPLLVHPLAGMAILASFRARSRGQRDGVEELYATCPATARTRTSAHLLTAWAPAASALVFGALFVVLVSRTTVATYGDIGGRQLAALFGAAALGLGATCLGVALARWLPWTLVPVAVVIAIAFATGALATQGTRTTAPGRALSTFMADPEIDLRLTAPHWLAHHLWIASLVGVVAVLALLRDRRDTRTLVAGAAVVAFAVASAVAATRPIDAADARRIAALVSDPSALPCRDVGGFAVCTFDADDELAAVFAETVQPIVAAATPGALADWSIQPALSTSWGNLDPEVQELAGTPPNRDRVLPIEYSGHHYALEALRLWTALAATGAVDDPASDLTTSIRGQARGTIALWLATRGADRDVQLDLTSNAVIESAHDGVRPWPDTCYGGDIPVQWAETDVTAARKMLSLPEAQVLAVLHPRWEHLTNRTTTTDELMLALGLDPVGVDGHTSGGSAC